MTNAGSKVNEFYVYAEGDRIIGEVENVSPGLTRTFHVDLSEPGTYQTACKPGMVGDGIRAAFTVTGSAGRADERRRARSTAAVAEYQAFVAAQSDAFLARTTEFVALVKAGKVDEAKALYPLARSLLGADRAGGRVVRRPRPEDRRPRRGRRRGHGVHRLPPPREGPVGRRPAARLARPSPTSCSPTSPSSSRKAKAVELNPLQLANGSKALLDEIATGKITGEEERYSHTDLWDFDGELRGLQGRDRGAAPVPQGREPALLATIDERATALDELIDSHQTATASCSTPR